MKLIQWFKNLFREPTESELWNRVLRFYVLKYHGYYLCICLSSMYGEGLLSKKQYSFLKSRVLDYIRPYATLEGKQNIRFDWGHHSKRGLRIKLIYSFMKASKIQENRK